MRDSAPESAPETSGGATPTDIPATPREFDGVNADDILVGWDGRVQIAYAHQHQVSHSWHASMMDLIAYDKTVGLNIIGSQPYRVFCSGPHGLVEGRNTAVQWFLDNSPHEWLMWIDTDMGFEADALDRLYATADPNLRPIVGGLCFAAKNIRADGYGGWIVRPLPTLFGMARDKSGQLGFVNMSTYPENVPIPVAGTGSAFILIHRTVLEAIRMKDGDHWYTPVAYADGKPISEDLSFCYRANRAGFATHVHTGIKTTHHKDVWISADMYEQPESDPIFGEVYNEYGIVPAG